MTTKRTYAPAPVHLALPKGRMQTGVLELLSAAGIDVKTGARGYRPVLSVAGFETKLLKPQNIVEMLAQGSRDVGFAGADWVAELGVELVELLDTELDPVRIVAAAPAELVRDGELPRRRLVVASEYSGLTANWIRARELDAVHVRTYGATEVFPPEDADVIVDNASTGQTLEANGLVVVDELMRSSTRLYANATALADDGKREAIERMTLVLRSVLEARSRVMLEVNVNAESLEALVDALPCMREPTIASLHGEAGFAVKAAVPRQDLPALVSAIKACGGTDIIVSSVSQIVP